jgi:hypothetical protein
MTVSRFSEESRLRSDLEDALRTKEQLAHTVASLSDANRHLLDVIRRSRQILESIVLVGHSKP